MGEAKLDEVKTTLPARRRVRAANRRFGPDDTHCGRQEAALRAEWSARRRAEASRTNQSWDSLLVQSFPADRSDTLSNFCPRRHRSALAASSASTRQENPAKRVSRHR